MIGRCGQREIWDIAITIGRDAGSRLPARFREEDAGPTAGGRYAAADDGEIRSRVVPGYLGM